MGVFRLVLGSASEGTDFSGFSGFCLVEKKKKKPAQGTSHKSCNDLVIPEEKKRSQERGESFSFVRSR
jgi:hypothetical protein